MKYLIAFAKGIVLAFYALALLSPMVPQLSDYQTILLTVTAILLLAHVAEFVLLKDKMRKASPQRSDHLVKTLLFGFGHWLPLLRQRSDP